MKKTKEKIQFLQTPYCWQIEGTILIAFKNRRHGYKTDNDNIEVSGNFVKFKHTKIRQTPFSDKFLVLIGDEEEVEIRIPHKKVLSIYDCNNGVLDAVWSIDPCELLAKQ